MAGANCKSLLASECVERYCETILLILGREETLVIKDCLCFWRRALALPADCLREEKIYYTLSERQLIVLFHFFANHGSCAERLDRQLRRGR